MFQRNRISRFNIFLGLFAILLIVFCPVVTQTIALVTKFSENISQSHYTPPSLNHFECASQFYKENNLNPKDFLSEISEEPISLQRHDGHNQVSLAEKSADHHSRMVTCGYCDLVHTATIVIAFYVIALEPPSKELNIITSTPYLTSLNFWSISSRAPPTQAFIA